MILSLLLLCIIQYYIPTIQTEESKVLSQHEPLGEFVSADDMICKNIANTTKIMVYFAGEKEKKVLPCDVTGSVKKPPKFDPPKFLWAKYVKSRKKYDTSLEFDSRRLDFKETGTMSYLEIVNYNADLDSTIWCCLVPYNAVFGFKWARASYAVLEVPEQKVTINAFPTNISDLHSGDDVTLKCWEGPSLLDKIQPEIFWKTTGAKDLDISTVASKITFTVSSKFNGLKIECGNIYQRDNAQGQPLVLKSDTVTLNVKYPPEFDEEATSPSREPIEGTIGSPVVIVSSIRSNPPMSRNSATVGWKKTGDIFDKRKKRSRLYSSEEAATNPCLTQDIDSFSENLVTLNETKSKYMFQSVISKTGAIQYYLIINNFAKQDVGCYVIQIRSRENQLQRSFYLLESTSSSTRQWDKSTFSNIFLWMTPLALFKVISLTITSL